MPLTCTFAQNLKMLVFGNMRFVYRTSVLAYLANMQNVLNMHFSCTKWCSACFPTLSTAKCKRFHKQTGLYVYAMFIQCFENKPVLFKMWIIKSQKYPKKPTQVGSNLSFKRWVVSGARHKYSERTGRYMSSRLCTIFMTGGNAS